MVVLKLGPLGGWEVKRTVASTSAVSPSRDEPPPYNDDSTREETKLSTDSNATTAVYRQRKFVPRLAPLALRNLPETLSLRKAPSYAEKSRTNRGQLRRYLIEIIGLTLGANFDELNAALYGRNMGDEKGVEKATSSILTPEEHEEFLRYSLIIQRLVKKSGTYETFETTVAERTEIYEMLVQHAEAFDVSLEVYALDLIGTYADHQCDPAQWNKTLVGYWWLHPGLLVTRSKSYKTRCTHMKRFLWFWLRMKRWFIFST